MRAGHPADAFQAVFTLSRGSRCLGWHVHGRTRAAEGGRAGLSGQMARRPGFTLVELLVTLALLAILTAALVPVLASARAFALRVVCTTRLKDLTLACNLHRTEKGVYPLQPGTTLGTQVTVSTNPVDLPALSPSSVPPPTPTDMDASFLNVLQPYLRFPRVADKAEVGELPHVLQSPTVEDA